MKIEMTTKLTRLNEFFELALFFVIGWHTFARCFSPLFQKFVHNHDPWDFVTYFDVLKWNEQQWWMLYGFFLLINFAGLRRDIFPALQMADPSGDHFACYPGGIR